MSVNIREFVQTEKKDDHFGRWQFANHIFQVSCKTPQDWSCRIGLFAKWGEGKTTALKYFQTIAEKEGHVVVWVTPWSANNINGFWIEFLHNLVVALENKGIKIDPKIQRKIKSGSLLAKHEETIKNFTRVGGGIAGMVGYGGVNDLVDASFSFGQRFLGADGATLKAIKAQLPNKRIVFIIDDLDRTDPAMIPKLLLSLRDLLDIDGYSYILAFDKNIVSKALKSHHRAWGNGHEFLEKIIDFPLFLPEATPKQSSEFFLAAMKEHCGFIPEKTIQIVADLLPLNPRKLKLLVRNISTLASQVERHNTEEIDWVTVLIFSMIKVESHDFFERFRKEPLQSFMLSIMERDEEKRGKIIDTEISKYMQAVRDADDSAKARIAALWKAWDERSGLSNKENILYNIQLDTHPHIITWKEFKEFWSRYSSGAKQDAAILESFLKERAEKSYASLTDTLEEFWNSICDYWSQKLNLAGSVYSEEDQNKAADEAIFVLEAIDLIYRNGLASIEKNYFHNIRYVRKFSEILTQWFHFRKNPGDIKARGREKEIFLSWAEEHSGDLNELYHLYQGMNDGFRNKEVKELGEVCIKKLMPRLTRESVCLLEQLGGIKLLYQREKYHGYRDILSNPNSTIFTTEKQSLLDILSQAQNNEIIHENARSYIEFLLSEARRENLNELFGKHDVLAALWKAAIARVIQYRKRKELVGDRTQLINGGVPEALLPIPDWLVI